MPGKHTKKRGRQKREEPRAKEDKGGEQGERGKEGQPANRDKKTEKQSNMFFIYPLLGGGNRASRRGKPKRKARDSR